MHIGTAWTLVNIWKDASFQYISNIEVLVDSLWTCAVVCSTRPLLYHSELLWESWDRIKTFEDGAAAGTGKGGKPVL